MKILATEKLSPHKFKDNHGYLICTDCIMARTGKQTYTRDDCFGDGDMTEIEVDRPEKEVFDPKTLASFENVPITIEHPENNVDSDNYNSLSVGYMRDIHKGTYNGQPVMLGTAVITDSEGIEKVESGELTNLSCGYDCDIDDDKNPKQTNIRGNHIALCEIPRAGITHIQDSMSKTKNPKKRAFLDSLVENHISYIEKEPNRFTFLTDDIGKAKRLARKIVGNNFLEDRDTLAIDFYKDNGKRTYKHGVFRNADLEEYRKERRENKMGKDEKDTFIKDRRKALRRTRPVVSSCDDDIVKVSKGWANKGKEGTHGTFRTKEGARRQQKAMFARGYKARDGVIIPANSMAEAIAKYRKMIRGRKTDSEDEVEKKVVWLDTGTAWLVPVIVENHTGDKMTFEDWIGWASTKAEEAGADYVLDTEINDRAEEEHKSVDEYIDGLEESGYVYFDRSHFNLPNIYLRVYSTQVKDPKATDDLSKAPVVKADDIVIW